MLWYDRLNLFWRERFLSSSYGGVNKEAIQAFEDAHSMKLPQEYRDYFQFVNGMSTAGIERGDENGFAFLQLSSVKSVASFSLETGWLIDTKINHHTTFVFIDYLQWCYAYAFETMPARSGIIYRLGSKVTEEIAPSLSRFVELYLQDDRRIYEPDAL